MNTTYEQCDDLVSELTDKFQGARYKVLDLDFFHTHVLTTRSYQFGVGDLQDLTVISDLDTVCACECSLRNKEVSFLITKVSLRRAIKNGHLRRI